LPDLLERAHRGGITVITKRGRPYAALVPAERVVAATRRLPLSGLRGTGKGLWGPDVTKAVSRMRDEWT
jgi:prevent-host-death family protein